MRLQGTRDRIVLLDERSPDDFGRMSGQDQLDPEVFNGRRHMCLRYRSLAKTHEKGPQRIGIRARSSRDRAALGFQILADLVLLLGDIREIKELIERTRDIDKGGFRKRSEECAQRIPRFVPCSAGPNGLRECADALDRLEELDATITPHHITQMSAELTHVSAQIRVERRMFTRADHPTGLRDCIDQGFTSSQRSGARHANALAQTRGRRSTYSAAAIRHAS